MTTTNNHHLSAITPPCPCRYSGLALAELDEWDTAITELDNALKEAAEARQQLLDAQAEMEAVEAKVILGIEGRNETERKARLVLLLREHVAYQDAVAEARSAREHLADAERRQLVLRQKCQLHRLAAIVSSGNLDD